MKFLKPWDLLDASKILNPGTPAAATDGVPRSYVADPATGVAALPLGTRVQAGEVTVAVKTGTSSVSTPITFTAGRFLAAPTVVPRVAVGQGSASTAGSGKFVVKANAPSATGFTLYVYHGSYPDTVTIDHSILCYWIAVQIP